MLGFSKQSFKLICHSQISPGSRKYFFYMRGHNLITCTLHVFASDYGPGITVLLPSDYQWLIHNVVAENFQYVEVLYRIVWIYTCMYRNISMIIKGMVWYGMVWYGMAWHGMAWHGMAWHGMAWHGMAWHGIASHRIASHRIASHRIVSYRIVSYRIVSYCIVSYRIVSYRIVSKLDHFGLNNQDKLNHTKASLGWINKGG